MSDFHLRLCTHETCGLRYPVAGASSIGERCPHCYAATVRIDVPSKHAALSTAARSRPGSPGRLEVLCDNIRSLHNVGSIFRTAEGAGVAHLYLCGITATPEHPKLKKTALGAEGALPWSYHKNACTQATALKQAGYRLWALEETPQAEFLFDVSLPADDRCVLVVGNEKLGVDPQLLQQCERVVALPMQGHKESRNVSVAAGVAMYHLLYASQKGTNA